MAIEKLFQKPENYVLAGQTREPAAPGDALGVEDMGDDNRSNWRQPRRGKDGVVSPASPKTKE